MTERSINPCAAAQHSAALEKSGLALALAAPAPLHNSAWVPSLGAGFDADGRWKRAYPPPAHTFTRLPDWRARLDGLIKARQNSLWEQGVHDCVNWIRLSVEAVSGVNIHLPATTLREALEMFDRAGGHMSDFWSTKLGPPQRPALARHGDVGLMLTDGYAAGVVVYDELVVGPGQFRLQAYQRSELRLCWPIG